MTILRLRLVVRDLTKSSTLHLRGILRDTNWTNRLAYFNSRLWSHKLEGKVMDLNPEGTWLNSNSFRGVLPSKRWKTTKCRSKDHDSPRNTFSTSTSNSKANRRILFPALLIWKLSFVPHNGWKVRPTASIFREPLIKKFVARTWSEAHWFLDKATFLPSLADNDSLSQLRVRSIPAYK